MSEETKIEMLDSAEKAFAEASVAATAKPVVVEPVAEAAIAVEPAVIIPALKPVAAEKAPAKKEPAKKAPAKVVAPKTAPAAKIAPAAKKSEIKKAAPKAAKTPAPKMAKPATKPTVAAKPIIKEKIMTKTTDITAKIKEVIADVQGKAKTAYAKGTEAVGEATEFTKGNFEAVVESGKIVTEGLKTLGADYVAESKKAYETVTADAKALSAVKSPTEFFELQTALLKRNFDSAIALTSKNTEVAMKLAGDAFAPISSRVALAVEKVKKAA